MTPNSAIKIYAHRGGAKTSAENTLEAFKIAGDIGADGFECDVQLSADQEVVIFHDDDLNRLAGLKKSIASLSFKEIKTVKILGNFQIPHLNDVIEFLSQHPKLECFFDLHIHSRKLTEILSRELTRLNSSIKTRCHVLGFHDPYAQELEFIKNNFPNLNISLMPQYPWKFIDKIKKTGAKSLCIGWDWSEINRFLFKTLSPLVGLKNQILLSQKAGVGVSGGIANSWDDMAWMIRQGADGIWTDDVNLGVKFRDFLKKQPLP